MTAAEIVPAFVRVVMVPPFRTPSFPPLLVPAAVIVPLFISSAICPPEVRKALLLPAEIIPLLVIMVLVEFPVDTASFESASAELIVVPELIVTLELSPEIFKTSQSEEIVSILPDTSEQSADNTLAQNRKFSERKINKYLTNFIHSLVS